MNAGLAGEQAGTTLRSSLISLTKPSEDASKKMDQLGVAITNSKGDMRPFSDIMNGLRDKTEGMGNAQKMAALSTIFGTEAASGMLAIIDSAPGTMEKFTKSLKNSDGASKKAADSMGDNFAGSVEELGGTIESIAINVSDVLTPTVQKGTEALSALGNGFNNLSPSAKSMVVWGTVIVGGVIPVSFAVYNVYKAVKSLREVMGSSKEFFSNYRNELSKTGNEALETASKMNKANQAMASSPSTSSGTGASKSKNKSYSELMRESHNQKMADAAEAKASETATKGGFFSKAGSRMKEGMKFGGASKAVPIIGTALAATSLIGMTKSTAGEDLGSFGGSLAGGAAGAAIGSAIFPGVGTAIGGTIGAFAGSSFGEKFGASVQEKWPEIKKTVSDFTDRHPILTKVATSVIPGAGIVKGAVSAKNAYNDKFKAPLTDKVELGKGVSASTEKAYNSYKKLNDKATEQLDLLYWSGEKISKKTAKSLKANYGDMADSIQKSMKANFSKSENTLSDFMKDSGLSKKDQNSILKDMKKSHKEQKAEVKKAQADINEIISKAAKEKRKLTKDEQEDINKIQTKMNNSAVRTLSKSAKEQRTIMTMLQANSSKISAKQAADVVKQSRKAKDKTVKDAEDKYKKVIAAADAEYKDIGSISEAQYKKITKEAEKTKKESVDQAEEMHVKIVEQAQQQAKGHIKQVDWETGEVLSKWDTFKVSLAKVVNSISSGINSVLKAFGSDLEISMWNPAGYSSTSAKSKVASNARGTNYHPGGASVVGEEGQELAYTPYGDAWLVGQNGAEIVDLPRGAKVLTASQTSQMLSGGLQGTMPGYASGIGGSIKEAASTVGNKAKDAASGALNKAGEITDDVISFITDPASAIKKLMAKNPLSNDIGGIGKGALGKIKDGAVDYLKDKVSSFGFGSTGGVGITGGAAAWSKMIMTAAAQMQVSLSGSELQGIIAQIQRESSGNEKIIQSAAVNDINMRNGNPARGLLQYIPSTFNAYKTKGFGDIMNGYHQLRAFFNNSNWRSDLPYGRSGWGPTGSRRFAKGGQVNQNGQVLVGEEGPELVDLPFGSYVNNNRKTNELLKNNGSPQINFAPVINIKIEGSSNDTNESKIQRAVNAAMEKAFKDFRAIIDSGVAY